MTMPTSFAGDDTSPRPFSSGFGTASSALLGRRCARRVSLGHRVLVDARMRKHAAADGQIGYADLTVGLGPALVAGRHAHVVVETSWDGLATVITEGASMPLAREPREIAEHARDRHVYAPVDGVFRTKVRIGDSVRQDQGVAEVGAVVLTAPLDGVLRGPFTTTCPLRLARRSSR